VSKVTLILIIMVEICARFRGDLGGQYADLGFAAGGNLITILSIAANEYLTAESSGGIEMLKGWHRRYS